MKASSLIMTDICLLDMIKTHQSNLVCRLLAWMFICALALCLVPNWLSFIWESTSLHSSEITKSPVDGIVICEKFYFAFMVKGRWMNVVHRLILTDSDDAQCKLQIRSVSSLLPKKSTWKVLSTSAYFFITF